MPTFTVPADFVGPYRLLDRLGEGGMGEVWLAQQTEPVRRQVALKIVKLGMDTRAVVARFEAERQILAIMDHPNIAKIFDGGVTSDSRPYFAMELVRGTPVTDYCDANRLPTAERLRMFADVCRAVQHAHQKGVIHRDLKPSNILVTAGATGPVTKVIDFGIAKAIGGQWLTDKTLHTRSGQIIGTPAYMSPEQAETTALDIDTRSDVYSLGAILYELLTGTLAFDPQPGTHLEFAIRELEIQRPSTRLRTLNTREVVAKHRGTTSTELRRLLRGDLDWIVLRAMERDRTRRYATANELAADVERHLRDEPVSARPPSAGYRFGRFARRHRAGFAAAIVAVFALVAGTAAATTGFVRARRAQAREQHEAGAARQVSEFLVSLFAANSPREARGNVVTAREMLDRGANRIRLELHEQPEVRWRLLGTMGRAYAALGLFEPAENLLREGLSAGRGLKTDDSAAVALATRDLANVLASRGKSAEADSLLRPSLVARIRAGRGEDTVAADLMMSLANVSMRRGRGAEADTLLRSALRIREKSSGPNGRSVAQPLAMLAYLHDDQPSAAEPLLRRAYDIERRARGAYDPSVLDMANNLGFMLWGLGRLVEAESLFAQVVADRERILGPQHPGVGGTLVNLGMTRLDENRPLDALPVLKRAVDLVGGFGKGDSATVGFALQYLGRAHLALGSLDSARTLLLRALSILERAAGPHHNHTAQARTAVGLLYLRMKRYDESEVSLRQAIADQEHNWGPMHRQLVEPLSVLSNLELARARYAEAESLHARSMRTAIATLGPNHPLTLRVGTQYVTSLRAAGRSGRADSLARTGGRP